MKTCFIAILLTFAASSVWAQHMEVEFLEICAFPDDKVIDKIDFALAADSGQIDSLYSKKISIRPNHCKKKETLEQYKYLIPLFSIGNPLRLQMASKGLFFYWMDKNKIFVGEEDQLARVTKLFDINIVRSLTINELKKEDELVELVSDYARVKLKLHYKGP